MAEPTRRSTRKRTQNTRYTNDILEEIRALVESDPEIPDVAAPIDDDHADDKDFSQDVVQVESEEEAGVLSGEDEMAFSENEQLRGSDFSSDELQDGRKKVKSKRQKKPKDTGSHSRGLPLDKKSVSKETTAIEISGGHPDDMEPVSRERAKWVRHETLPPRCPTSKGTGGLDHPFIFTKERRDAEAESFRKWYIDDGGQEKMEKAQDIISLDGESARSYTPQTRSYHDVLLGPYGNQKLFKVKTGNTLSIPDAWVTAEAQIDPAPEKPQEHSRDGWLMNLGDRIHCLGWAPNHGGDMQYLAIATTSDPPPNHPRVTAFEPVDPYKASITIWELRSKDEEGARMMDMSIEPKIMQVLCTEWGAIRRMQWCPAAGPMYDKEEDGEGSLKSIGLLAGIWTDGFLRVLDVKVDPTRRTRGIFAKYQEAAFASRPPETICSCLSWVSATNLAAGCANGFVAIWNIAKHITSSTESPPSPTSTPSPSPTLPPAPFFYHPLHLTYILNITSHHPFPTTHITTCSADGRLCLTSLSHPQTDTVLSPRHRNPISPLTYSPHILSILSPDEQDTIRSFALRQFFSPRSVAKASAQVTCLAAGSTHPCCLIGSADGTVMLTNPMRRLYRRKDNPAIAAAWQQVWFRHEWVAKKPYGSDLTLPSPPLSFPHPDQSDEPKPHHHHPLLPPGLDQKSYDIPPPPSLPPHSSLPRPGLARHLESFKLQSVPLVRNLTNSVRPFANPRAAGDFKQHYSAAAAAQESEGVLYQTIFEEEAAVTAVGWNPNVGVGGWAAAGMGSGVVRVGDLGI